MSKAIVFIYLMAFGINAVASECRTVAEKIATDFVKHAEYHTGIGIGLNKLVSSQDDKIYKFSVYEDYNSSNAYEVMVETISAGQGCLAKSVVWTRPPYRLSTNTN